MDVITTVLAIIGVGSIFIIGIIVGAIIVINGIKKIINFFRGN